MRAGNGIILGAAAACAAYWASPYIATARFAHAAARGDTATVLSRLDLPRIRTSFARQIVRAYPVDAALVAQVDPVARHAANLVAVAYVDAIIADHLTEEAILNALAGRKDGREGALPARLRLPSANAFSGALDIFMSSGFSGPISFAVDVKAEPSGTYRLGFRLVGARWRLVSIGLPSPVVAQAIAELRMRLAAKRQG